MINSKTALLSSSGDSRLFYCHAQTETDTGHIVDMATVSNKAILGRGGNKIASSI